MRKMRKGLGTIEDVRRLIGMRSPRESFWFKRFFSHTILPLFSVILSSSVCGCTLYVYVYACVQEHAAYRGPSLTEAYSSLIPYLLTLAFETRSLTDPRAHQMSHLPVSNPQSWSSRNTLPSPRFFFFCGCWRSEHRSYAWAARTLPPESVPQLHMAFIG